MRPIFMPERAKARSADCAPGPGVLVLGTEEKKFVRITATIDSQTALETQMQTSWTSQTPYRGLKGQTGIATMQDHLLGLSDLTSFVTH